MADTAPKPPSEVPDERLNKAKRGRESALSTPTDLNVKRNRIDDDLEANTRQSLSPPASAPLPLGNINEGSKVKAIRRQVKNMTTGEEQEQDSAMTAEPVSSAVNEHQTASAESFHVPAETTAKDDEIALGESAASKGVDAADVDTQASDIPVSAQSESLAEASDTASTASSATTSMKPSSFATFSKAASPFSAVPTSSTSAFGSPKINSTSAAPEALPVSRPNLALLTRVGQGSMRPPSPASSIRAEVGSVAPTSRRGSFSGSVGTVSTEDNADLLSADTTAPETSLAEIQQSISQGTPVMGTIAPHSTPAVRSSGLPMSASTGAPLSPSMGGASALFSPGAVNRALESEAAAAGPSSSFSAFAPPKTNVTASPSPFATAAGSTPSAFGKAKSAATGFGSFSSFSSPFARSQSPKDAASSSAKNASSSSSSSAQKSATASPFAKMASGSSNVLSQSPSGLSSPTKESPIASSSSDAAYQSTSKKAETSSPLKQVFTEQEVITGEEEEDVVFSMRAKLFVIAGAEYREAGIGALRINRDSSGDKPRIRLLMRVDATHRLVLNALVFPKMKYEIVEGKYVRFSVFVDGALSTFLAKFGNPASAKQLVAALDDCVSILQDAGGTEDRGDV